MVKIDLHTHSTASYDGGIALLQYSKLLDRGVLDVIAITDHDRIDFALNAREVLGNDRIIVGQEVTTTDGDILGLYLNTPIAKGLNAKRAAEEIHKQGGIVCIPHPFETLRKGLSSQVLDSMVDSIDLFETNNGRAVFQNYSSRAVSWAKTRNKPAVANSDAHGYKGVGRTYTLIQKLPSSPRELVELIKFAKLTTNNPPLISLSYPAKNKILKKLGINK